MQEQGYDNHIKTVMAPAAKLLLYGRLARVSISPMDVMGFSLNGTVEYCRNHGSHQLSFGREGGRGGGTWPPKRQGRRVPAAGITATATANAATPLPAPLENATVTGEEAAKSRRRTRGEPAEERRGTGEEPAMNRRGTGEEPANSVDIDR